MTDLVCTARRIGDFESRTEEYELTFSVNRNGDVADGEAENSVAVKYAAARAFEINHALDSCVETVRETISRANLEARPTDEKLSQFSWRAMQSVKYDEGASKTSTLEL